jgi:hypothetical protein
MLAKLVQCGSGTVVPENDYHGMFMKRWETAGEPLSHSISDAIRLFGEWQAEHFADMREYATQILVREKADAETFTDPLEREDVGVAAEDGKAKKNSQKVK